MMPADHLSFFVSRRGTAHGPLTWDDIRSYIAYGSLRPTDLLRTNESSQWRPAIEWARIMDGPSEEELEAAREPLNRWQSMFQSMHAWWCRLTHGKPQAASPTRRRTVRFRDWEHVPQDQRSTTVLNGLVIGFLLFPPRLWSACSKVFSNRIFRRTTDEAGFLKVWSSKMDTVCSALILLNTIWWIVLLFMFQQHLLPVLKDAGGAFVDSIESWIMESRH